MNYSHLQKFKTSHDFQAFLCYDVRLFNFMMIFFYCIIQFGLKKNVRKERGPFIQQNTHAPYVCGFA